MTIGGTILGTLEQPEGPDIAHASLSMGVVTEATLSFELVAEAEISLWP